MSRFILCVLTLCMLATVPVSAAIVPGEIPPALAPWQQWVLHGQEEALCPGRYNDGDAVRCRWPSQLKIEITADGGTFEQGWLMFTDGWAPLPGSEMVWPDSVAVDGRSLPVVRHKNGPAVRLTAGEHRIVGHFSWRRIPETISVPPDLGLLSLSIEGHAVEPPQIDDQGRLWLREHQSAESHEDRLQVKIFRLFDDTIPMQVTSLLQLDIAGNAREIKLSGVLVPSSIPMKLESALPVRMDADGTITAQVRPGRWPIRILARMPGPQLKINAGDLPYGDEIWSFRPRHALRMVQITGAPPVEPNQTELPAEWHTYQAFLIHPQSALTIEEIRRGDANPAPDRLSLQRNWWLDFDGRGFTVHDEISGSLSRQWYLAVNPPMVLGRVAVAGQDRVITEQGPERKTGIELRQGNLELQGDSRVPQRTAAISAAGWDHDFQSLSGRLHLPPGWRLFAAAGVDSTSDSWLQHWTLLDFFMVLIIAFAVFKLRNWRWGLVALGAMLLIFHEPGAPRQVWIHLLAVLGLLPLMPAGWPRRLVALWGIATVVVLLTIAVPFVVEQIRWGLYPQLAPHNQYPQPMAQVGSFEKQAREPEPEAAPVYERRMLSKRQSLSDARLAPPISSQGTQLAQQDPDALIPTGPGLPDWRWQSIDLNWSGPVAKDQTLRLYLLSPAVNLALALARVGLMILLMWTLIDWRPWWAKLRLRFNPGMAALLTLLCVGALFPGRSMADESAFPSPALLDELKQRLLEKPDCLPDCTDITRMEVSAAGENIQVLLKINNAERVAVPLPVNRRSWTPSQILLDNAPIRGLARDESGQLWALVPEGLHLIVLLGSAGGEALVQIPVPLKPHVAAFAVQGWRLEGIQADGSAGSGIQLTRQQDNQAAGAEHSANHANNALPPFLSIERVYHLGLTWQVTTTITRLTPKGAPVVVNVPLLPDEAVLTPGIPVEQGEALINMAADQVALSYESHLKPVPQIVLLAPRAVPWTETWVLDASAIWHCDVEGIAPVHHQDGAGQWQPQWQPWPGEQVTLHIQRPPAVAGQLKTIVRADMSLTPGQRFARGELALTLRSSRGGQQTLELPPKANLQEITIDGKSLPVQQDGAFVTVPLQPGTQHIGVRWHQLAPFTTLYQAPAVKLGQPAVNARVTIQVPENRWILLVGGPAWGPAVLFWSYLGAILLAGLILGRVPWTPLKTWQWMLLGLGLTQIPAPMALVIIGWLLVLGLRARGTMPRSWVAFNLVQAGLVLWAVVAIALLFTAVQAGLVGQPEMQIAGNQSTFLSLNWTQDRIGGTLPQPWVLSLPMWVFRIVMLAWSAWLALALLSWLKWAWHCMNQGGLWQKPVRRHPPKGADEVRG